MKGTTPIWVIEDPTHGARGCILGADDAWLPSSNGMSARAARLFPNEMWATQEARSLVAAGHYVARQVTLDDATFTLTFSTIEVKPAKPSPTPPMIQTRRKACPFCGTFTSLRGRWDADRELIRWKCRWWFDIGCGAKWVERPPPRWSEPILTGMLATFEGRLARLEGKSEPR